MWGQEPFTKLSLPNFTLDGLLTAKQMPLSVSKTSVATRLDTPELPLDYAPARKRARGQSLAEELAAFREFGEATRKLVTTFPTAGDQAREVPTFVNEFWTAKQRQASSLQEVSYRACFKPQLPRFFIERLTQPGEVVYDPFMGRGTTVVEAALLGRVPCGCDINPLSVVLTRPRLRPPQPRRGRPTPPAN